LVYFLNVIFKDINFEPITIFYGNNGTGKTTLINIIAEKLQASKKSPINKGTLFKLYADACNYELVNDYEEVSDT